MPRCYALRPAYAASGLFQCLVGYIGYEEFLFSLEGGIMVVHGNGSSPQRFHPSKCRCEHNRTYSGAGGHEAFDIHLRSFAAVVSIENPAEAQNYPWCAYLNLGGGATNCGFATYQQ